MSQFFGFGQTGPAPTLPPPVPKKQDDPIKKAADAALTDRNREGWASTFLTNPAMNRKAQKNEEQFLGGGYLL